MALHSCFQPASLTPHPAPLQTWRLRAGLEVEESQPTRRQCRGAVRRHWDSVPELSGTEAVRGGPDHRASPTLMADLQLLQQQDLVLGPQPGQPNPSTWRNAPCGRWCSSTLDASWRMGSTVVGRLTNVVNSWFCPAHFGPMSKRGQELHQQLREMHCGAML